MHKRPSVANGVAVMFVCATVMLTCGCQAFWGSVEKKDPATAGALNARYDQEDLLTLSATMSQAIMAQRFGPDDKKPVLVDMGIQNRTKSHIDMRAISDNITTRLFNAGKVRLVNAASRDDLLREQGYQLANCDPATRAAIGKQLGAGYMLTGSLVEIEKKSMREARVSRKQDVYYQLTVQITDLTTGEVVVSQQKDRLRRASQPLIGW